MRFAMRVIEFSRSPMNPIKEFESVAASALPLGDGNGEMHVYYLRFEAGGRIGEHRAGFDQLFLVIEGRAWAMGEEGRRIELASGQGAYFRTGEMHSKGSDSGATVLMIQASRLDAAL